MADSLSAHLEEIKGEIATLVPWSSPRSHSGDSPPLLEHTQTRMHPYFVCRTPHPAGILSGQADMLDTLWAAAPGDRGDMGTLLGRGKAFPKALSTGPSLFPVR